MPLLKLLFSLRENLGRALALARDARVPARLKWLALGLAIFIVSPLNILGDLPLLGIADDAAMLALLLNWFVRAAGKHADAGFTTAPGASTARDVSPIG